MTTGEQVSLFLLDFTCQAIHHVLVKRGKYDHHLRSRQLLGDLFEACYWQARDIDGGTA